MNSNAQRFSISFEGMDQADAAVAAQDVRERLLDLAPAGTRVDLERSDPEDMTVGDHLLIGFEHFAVLTTASILFDAVKPQMKEFIKVILSRKEGNRRTVIDNANPDPLQDIQEFLS